MTKIWVVISYSDGGLAAYRTEDEAKEACDTYDSSGLYPHHETYICEVFFPD